MKKSLITIVISALLLFTTTNIAFAAPSFPSCEGRDGNGDWASYDQGSHAVIGYDYLFYGADDVYSLDDGNFLQCLCPNDTETGIQTNWWKIGDSLSAYEIDEYEQQGWMLTHGSYWNLQDATYLAKNVNFSCVEPTPTPSPTATPVPSPTPTATPTSTPDNFSSECVLLEASTYGGTAPLHVEFQASGADTNGYIEEYKFDFGKDIIVTDSSSTSYRFDNSGNYGVRLSVKDSRGVWKTDDDCNVNINVTSQPQVLGASDTSELPETGIPYYALGSLVTGIAGIGLYLKTR